MVDPDAVAQAGAGSRQITPNPGTPEEVPRGPVPPGPPAQLVITAPMLSEVPRGLSLIGLGEARFLAETSSHLPSDGTRLESLPSMGDRIVTGPRPGPELAAPRSELASSVSQQILTAVQRQNGAVQMEVALSPAELGRVRIRMEAQEGGLLISIQADRGETQDLMRRNIDQLERSFRDLGYENLAFQFGAQGQGRQETGAEWSGDGGVSSPEAEGGPPIDGPGPGRGLLARAAGPGQLDIKL